MQRESVPIEQQRLKERRQLEEDSQSVRQNLIHRLEVETERNREFVRRLEIAAVSQETSVEHLTEKLETLNLRK